MVFVGFKGGGKTFKIRFRCYTSKGGYINYPTFDATSLLGPPVIRNSQATRSTKLPLCIPVHAIIQGYGNSYYKRTQYYRITAVQQQCRHMLP